MTESYTYETIPTEQIEFDRENPRIKMALEKYGDKLNDERIRFALQSATEGSGSTSSYRSLKDSIRAAKKINVPIVVYPTDHKFVCIDGNTRLAIYHELKTEEALGNWTAIPCQILNQPEQRDIETIRVAAHLIGAREWPAYEKAQYLHYLRSQQFMTYDEMIAICGGNKTTINQQIDAFHDMNTYYRDVNNDDAFRVDRFSGFVELQKAKIKESIFDAGFDLEDFGRWIKDGQIYKLADVRKLPRVLADDEAKDAFVNGGIRSIEAAIDIVDTNNHKKDDIVPEQMTVKDTSLSALAEALIQRIKSLPRNEFIALRDNQNATEQRGIETLEELSDHLLDLIRDVTK